MNSFFIQELQTVGIFIIASFLLSSVLLAAVYILGFTSKIDFEKSSAYECGFNLFQKHNIFWSPICFDCNNVFIIWYWGIIFFPLCNSIYFLDTAALQFLTIFFIFVTLGIYMKYLAAY